MECIKKLLPNNTNLYAVSPLPLFYPIPCTVTTGSVMFMHVLGFGFGVGMGPYPTQTQISAHAQTSLSPWFKCLSFLQYRRHSVVMMSLKQLSLSCVMLQYVCENVLKLLAQHVNSMRLSPPEYMTQFMIFSFCCCTQLLYSMQIFAVPVLH